MRKHVQQLVTISVLAASLGACSNLNRLGSIGQEPPMSAIKDVVAPVRESTISVPQPDPNRKHEANSLWRTGARAFFEDQRASQVGDILTVQIAIADQAQIGNQTSRSRSSSEEVGLDNFGGVETAIPFLYTNNDAPDGSIHDGIRDEFDPGSLVDADSASNYTGNGAVNRSETINLTVAAIVTDVLPNGNLVIQGRQEVRVNFEKRELLIAGIVRPEDISSANIVQHTQVAEARIAYGGKGQLTDVQQPRYGTQLYDIVFPF